MKIVIWQAQYWDLLLSETWTKEGGQYLPLSHNVNKKVAAFFLPLFASKLYLYIFPQYCTVMSEKIKLNFGSQIRLL